MGIKALQEFLESHCSGACVSVDLLKISRGYVPKRRGRFAEPGQFCLVVDAESCLDRLYGGFFSDWVCGGQWNRMTAFLSSLVQACHSANMELVVFFNSALETQKMGEWYNEQSNQKKKVQAVFRHLYNKGTPPPKVWWTPPIFLRGALRMALRHLGVTVACSMDDHAQEVIGYCREHNLQGIIAQDSVYAIFDPPRYFSSNNLKLTYKGSLETKEYIMDEIAKCLDLNPNRFCIFAALLGNHILPDEDLYDFFRIQLDKNQEAGKPAKPTPENVIRAVVDFVRSLPVVDSLDTVGEEVFRNSKGNKQELVGTFKQSVQYYLNGTQDGFLKYKPRLMPGSPRQGNYPAPQHLQGRSLSVETGPYGDANNHQAAEAPSIVVEAPNKGNLNSNLHTLDNKMQNLHLDGKMTDPAVAGQIEHDKLAAISSSSSSSSGSSPNRQSPEAGSWSAKTPVAQNKLNQPKGIEHDTKLPRFPPEIMRIASERHQKGLMSPWIYQLLSQGEVKIPVTLEDDSSREVPLSLELYRPVRQTVYSVLFNLNKQKIVYESQRTGDELPPKTFEVMVKEWVIRRNGTRYDTVIARPVDWKTPSIERMWLGQQVDDKTRRLRAFLTCMESDTPLMLNTQYVPQQLLLLCCVLRYILRFGRILQRPDLDAFLAMSVSPLLHDVQTMQDLKLPNVQPRGVQLAGIFMAGVETAIFANDVCGAPIPWTMTCPWLFFDGKLFHFKLLKANNNTPLIDMCDGQVDQVLRVERMRQAIMEGLKVEFAKPLLPPAAMYTHYPYPPYGPPPPFDYRPAGARGMPPGPHMGPPLGGPGPHKAQGRGRGILGRLSGMGQNNVGRSPIDARGGQLEIAGVVVGSWGPNLSGDRDGHGNNHLSPHVMSVGGPRRYEHRGMAPRGPAGWGRPPPGWGRQAAQWGRTSGGWGRPGSWATRAIRGRPAMYGIGRGMRPMDRGYGRGRGLRVVRRTVRMRPRPTQTKTNKVSKGRGVTVESTEENDVETEEILDDEEGNDVYADAEDNGAINKALNQDGLQSPDSGIHGDKSNIDLNVTA